MDIYSVSRNFWNFAFDNPEKISPNHAAIFFFAIEHCNRLGWKEKFGFPTQMVMDAIGIKKYQTYIRYFNELVDWNFFVLIEKSKNQYSANIISIKSAMPKNGKALDKAIGKHGAKQTEKQLEPNGQSKHKSMDSIDIPIYQETNKPIYKETVAVTPTVFKDSIHECYDHLIKFFPEDVRPKNIKAENSWKEEIRKLVELDGYTENDIIHVTKLAREDQFWSKNFLSISKLRSKDKHGIMYILVFKNNFINNRSTNGQNRNEQLAAALHKRFNPES